MDSRFEIGVTETAQAQYECLKSDKGLARQFKAVDKALRLMEVNLRHPSLRTHKHASLRGPGACDVFESYAQNNTPGAYRIFWHYGPKAKQISVIAIIPHP